MYMEKPFKLITELNRNSNTAHPVRSFKSERTARIAAARYLNHVYDGTDGLQEVVEIIGPMLRTELTTSRQTEIVVKSLHRDMGLVTGVASA